VLILDKYWDLEFDLAEIADKYRVTRKQLLDTPLDLDDWIRVKDIIQAQVDLLESKGRSRPPPHLRLLRGK
jgi:hypothetical protein